MKTFGIYACGFLEESGEIKPGITFVNGEVEVNNSATDEEIEKACYERLSKEYDGKNTAASHLSKNLNWDTFIWRKVQVNWGDGEDSSRKKGADKKLHEYYVKNGIKQHRDSKTGNTTEEFDFGPDYVKIIDEAISQCFGHRKAMKLKLLPVQDRCIQKMIQAERFYREFLVSVLCRIGKSVISLYFCCTIKKFKRVLFITAKCDALNSIYDDWLKFFCEDYEFVTKNEILRGNSKILDSNKKCIAAMSMQSTAIGINGNKENEEDENKIDINDKQNSKLLKELQKYEWDAVIIDECHFGIDTLRSSKTMKKLLKNSPHCFKIEMSATPYKKLKAGDYTEENMFNYDQYDEAIDPENKEAKEKKDYSKYLPVVNFHLNLFNNWLKNGIICRLNGAGRFSKKQKDEKITYINERLVEYGKQFPDFVYSWDSFFSDSSTGFNVESISWMMDSLFENVIFKYAVNAKTFAIYVNKIKHGKKLEDALNRLGKFTVINVCGSNRTSIYELNRKLKESVENKDEKRVVMISCSRYLTASTLKYLDCFIFMGTCNSPEKFTQFGFRCKNKRPGRKCPGYIFDFNTETVLRSKSFLYDLLIPKEKYEKKPWEKMTEDYDKECFELIEILNEHDIEKIDIMEEMHEIFHKTSIFENRNLVEDVIGLSNLKNFTVSINLHNLLVDASGKGTSMLQITLKQTNGKPKKIGKPKNKNNGNGKNTYISDIDKFLSVCEQTLFMMHTYNLSELNEVIQSDEMKKCWYMHTYADPGLFEKIKEWSKQNDNGFLWEKFCYWFTEESKRLKKIFEAA